MTGPQDEGPYLALRRRAKRTEEVGAANVLGEKMKKWQRASYAIALGMGVISSTQFSFAQEEAPPQEAIQPAVPQAPPEQPQEAAQPAAPQAAPE